MELTIEQSCPSCGAAIVLKEDDKLIRCQFCDVSNFRLDSSAARYTLPYSLPPDVDENDLIFIPYLRFKGTVYFVEREEVRHKIVDTTQLGVEGGGFPPSLGLRPQVMKVRPVTSGLEGSFALHTLPVKAAFIQATRLVELFSAAKSKSVVHKAFIGETISVIYQPYYTRGEAVIDAVDGRETVGLEVESLLSNSATASKKNWEPSFIGTLCKKCGGLLVGKRDSRVLVCENCLTHWLENRGALQAVDWSVVEWNGGNVAYFPFWKICFSSSGYRLEDFNDLIRFTNQPVVWSADAKAEKILFLVPGFKINPKMFLQIASQLTMAQNRLGTSIDGKRVKAHPVNLQLSEAVQSVKSVLANLTVGKKKKLHHLSEMTIKVNRTELLYIPFNKSVHDYTQCHTSASIQVAAVRYGRSL